MGCGKVCLTLEDGLVLEDTVTHSINLPLQSSSALEGYKYEAIADEMIEEVTDSLVQPVIVESWREVIGDHRDAQMVEVIL